MLTPTIELSRRPISFTTKNITTLGTALGTYPTPQSVTISDTTAGVTIYYTTNGSIPTTSSTWCANPCTITASSTTTVKATAAATGVSQSTVGFASYTITGH